MQGAASVLGGEAAGGRGVDAAHDGRWRLEDERNGDHDDEGQDGEDTVEVGLVHVLTDATCDAVTTNGDCVSAQSAGGTPCEHAIGYWIGLSGDDSVQTSTGSVFHPETSMSTSGVTKVYKSRLPHLAP